MPLYTYTTPAGDEFTEYFDMGSRPETITVKNGDIAYYDFAATQRPSCESESLKHGAWPMESDASGVHTSQVKEMEALGAKNGVDLKYNHKNGKAIYDNQQHQDRCLNFLGIQNKAHYR